MTYKIEIVAETMGQRITFLRTRLGLTMMELAQITGLSQASISTYESDKAQPNAVSLLRLIEALQTDIKYLVDGVYADEVEFDDQLLLKKFKKLPKVYKKQILDMVNLMVEKVKLDSLLANGGKSINTKVRSFLKEDGV
jgi:transcriptional regulator with XRE-family HTH domain